MAYLCPTLKWLSFHIDNNSDFLLVKDGWFCKGNCHFNIEYQLSDLEEKILISQEKVNLIKVPDECMWNSNYYHVHMSLNINFACYLLNKPLLVTWSQLNVPGSSTWKVVCLGTCVSVPDKCGTGCLPPCK